MQRFILLIFAFVIMGCGTCQAAVLVMSPNGTLVSKATLAAAVASADTVGKTIVVTSPITINTLTVPTTIALRVEKGGLITVNAGQTLTVNGPFAGPGSAVFAGSGTVNLVNEGSVFGFTTNIGGNEPRGRLNVYSEIMPSPQTVAGYPLGNDLALMARGSADIHLRTMPGDLTSTTSVSPGSRLISVGSTAILPTAATGATLIVDPDTANEEYIVKANWSITNATQMTALFTKSHTQPFVVRMVGSISLNTRNLFVNGEDPSDRPLRVVDRNVNPMMFLPNDVGGTWPLSAIRFPVPITGADAYGAPGNLLFRNNSSANFIEFLKSDGSLLMAIGDGGVQFVGTIPNPTTFRVLAAEQAVLPYSASIAVNALSATRFILGPNNGTAFTIQTPTNPTLGQEIVFNIENTTGAPLGALTWGAGYKLSAWTQPANGFNRSMTFFYNGTWWREKSRTGDVPN